MGIVGAKEALLLFLLAIPVGIVLIVALAVNLQHLVFYFNSKVDVMKKFR
jgi:hypothetical protein